jgi:hypothetical protein
MKRFVGLVFWSHLVKLRLDASRETVDVSSLFFLFFSPGRRSHRVAGRGRGPEPGRAEDAGEVPRALRERSRGASAKRASVGRAEGG